MPFDKRYMKQALLNLVKNAVAAMPKGGTLHLSIRAVNDELKLAVGDTGSGIPEDKLGKLFEPYYKTKENGTGLGLTLTYKIIKEHGGDVTVQSRQGQGSTFTITIPIPQKDRKMITGTCPEDEDCQAGLEGGSEGKNEEPA